MPKSVLSAADKPTSVDRERADKVAVPPAGSSAAPTTSSTAALLPAATLIDAPADPGTKHPASQPVGSTVANGPVGAVPTAAIPKPAEPVPLSTGITTVSSAYGPSADSADGSALQSAHPVAAPIPIVPAQPPLPWPATVATDGTHSSALCVGASTRTTLGSARHRDLSLSEFDMTVADVPFADLELASMDDLKELETLLATDAQCRRAKAPSALQPMPAPPYLEPLRPTSAPAAPSSLDDARARTVRDRALIEEFEGVATPFEQMALSAYDDRSALHAVFSGGDLRGGLQPERGPPAPQRQGSAH